MKSLDTFYLYLENIDELDVNWLRSQMAMVAQEPVLFQTTIKENIRLGRLGIYYL